MKRLLVLGIMMVAMLACSGESVDSSAEDSSTGDGSIKDSSTKDSSTKDSSTKDGSTKDGSTKDGSSDANDDQQKSDGHVECPPPDSHSGDCSKVSYFQCGFEAQCEAGTVTITWHEHVFCGGEEHERIYGYGCKYVCPEACVTGEALWGLWGLTGDDLVAAMCVSSDAGADGSSDADTDGSSDADTDGSSDADTDGSSDADTDGSSDASTDGSDKE